jgi:hypothetical protein
MEARTPTLKDVSAAIAEPIRLLGFCRDAAGTHGVRGSVLVAARPTALKTMSELERLDVALSRARAAMRACESLEATLLARSEGLRERQAGRRAA